MILGLLPTPCTRSGFKLAKERTWLRRASVWKSMRSTFRPALSWSRTHDIAASVSGGNGSISPAGTTYVADGNDQTYTFTADPGYVLDGVRVDGSYVGNASSYTFRDVVTSHTIVANFIPRSPSLNAGLLPLEYRAARSRWARHDRSGRAHRCEEVRFLGCLSLQPVRDEKPPSWAASLSNRQRQCGLRTSGIFSRRAASGIRMVRDSSSVDRALLRARQES